MPLLIAITGGSGSGKTLVSEALKDALPGQVSILSYDNYYNDNSALPMEERAKLNYDAPEAFDQALFQEHLGMLKEGKSIMIPQYDFSTHSRKAEGKVFVPSDIILCEGIMVMHLPKENYDYCVFVDADSDIRLSRRILRDMATRGRTAESVIAQYMATVKPMHVKYIRPARKKADFLFENNGNSGLDPKEMARLLEAIENLKK